MKKIYTLLCAALVAITAVAAPSMATLKPVVDQKKVNEMLARAENKAAMFHMGQKVDDVMTREWVDESGKTWELMIAKEAAVVDFFSWSSDGDEAAAPSIQMIPFYVAAYILNAYDANGQMTDHLIAPLSWPARAMYDDPYNYVINVVNPLFEDEDVDVNGYDMSITPLDVLCNSDTESKEFVMLEMTADTGISALFYPDYNSNNTVKNWKIMDLGFDGYYGSQPCYLFTDNTRTSVLKFNSYDEDGDYISADMNFYVQYAQSGQINKLAATYEGESTAIGFVLHNYKYEIGEVNIYNCGSYSSDTKDFETNYNVLWGPLQRYMIFWCGPKMTIVNQGNKYADNAIKFSSADGGAITEEDATFGFAPVYLADGEALPAEQSWKMQNLIEDEDEAGVYVANCPEPGTMMPGAYDPQSVPWTQTDGVQLIYQYQSAATVAPSQIDLGTPNGITFYLRDFYGNTYYGEFAKEVKYFDNPNDLSSVKKINPVGSLDSIENVAVDANAPVEYFNLQGIRVANPEKGLYIVRQGNKVTKQVIR